MHYLTLFLSLLLFILLCMLGMVNGIGKHTHDTTAIGEPQCIINLPATTIYVNEDCLGYEGLAWIYDKKICVRGKFLADGKVDPDDDTLGHEIQHLMSMYNKRIVDPDK